MNIAYLLLVILVTTSSERIKNWLVLKQEQKDYTY